MKSLGIYFYASLVINVLLVTLIIVALKSDYFDFFLFNKSTPTICSLADKWGVASNDKEKIKVGTLCLVNQNSEQAEQYGEEEEEPQ